MQHLEVEIRVSRQAAAQELVMQPRPPGSDSPPSISVSSSCCSLCPQFQISCQPPHHHNPLPGKSCRLTVGTTYNLLVSYVRLDSHRLTPFALEEKKTWHLYLAAFLHIPHFAGPAELQKRSSYFISRNEEVWWGFVLYVHVKKPQTHNFSWKTGYIDYQNFNVKINTEKSNSEIWKM